MIVRRLSPEVLNQPITAVQSLITKHDLTIVLARQKINTLLVESTFNEGSISPYHSWERSSSTPFFSSSGAGALAAVLVPVLMLVLVSVFVLVAALVLVTVLVLVFVAVLVLVLVGRLVLVLVAVLVFVLVDVVMLVLVGMLVLVMQDTENK